MERIKTETKDFIENKIFKGHILAYEHKTNEKI